MPKWVRLATTSGQFWDSNLGWGLVGQEVKQLPDLVPLESLTAERLRLGSILECDPPEDQKPVSEPKAERRQKEKPAPPQPDEATAVPTTEAAAPEHVITAAKQIKRKTRPPATSPRKSRKRKAE